jgi:hypothetical protein
MERNCSQGGEKEEEEEVEELPGTLPMGVDEGMRQRESKGESSSDGQAH